MKPITNWRKATVVDLEADGLLQTVTQMHVMSYKMHSPKLEGAFIEATIRRDKNDRSGRDYKAQVVAFFKYHIDNGVPVVMHNGIGYDAPAVEKLLGIDLSKLMVIDTLATSWYLSPERNLHGLDSFFGDYGIAKPAIEHWEQQEGETLEEFLDKMEHRCSMDVKINWALWADHMVRLEDIYTIAQEAIDYGYTDPKTDNWLPVGGTRISPDEWIPIDDMVGRSVDKAVDSILMFLMFKMDCARLQEATRWQADIEHINEAHDKLEGIVADAKAKLESVMPKVPKYVKKTQPKADPFKKNGDRNSHWVKWDEVMRQLAEGVKDPETNAVMVFVNPEDGLCPETGNQFYRVWNKNEEPNSGSPVQVKDFLFGMGWVPQTFKYEKDEDAFNAWVASKPKGKAAKNQKAWADWKAARPKEREIPQITRAGDDGKELCPSLEDLAEEVPEIKVYADFTVAKNRLSTLKGFKEAMEDGQWLKARIGGFTNTLRVKHRELVNLPGTDKAYGYDIRGGLISGLRKVLVGSDMSSLEDRVKHHFMLPHDPEYVATMQADDFDPHILMALIAKMVTQQEFDDFKAGNKSANAKAARKKGKTTNYASVYNAGAAKIAQAAGVPESEGIILHKAYWELNWSVKAIAEEQVVIRDARGGKWLVNPINGLCYSLRKESDRFSTLAQGTGSYFFDMWVDNILTAMEAKWGVKRLSGSFHDECIICMGDTEENRAAIAAIIKEAVHKVNEDFGLRRKLDCETQFGERYSDIH